jgi:hypothetical protein
LELAIDGHRVKFVPKPHRNANARYLRYIPSGLLCRCRAACSRF